MLQRDPKVSFVAPQVSSKVHAQGRGVIGAKGSLRIGNAIASLSQGPLSCHGTFLNSAVSDATAIGVLWLMDCVGAVWKECHAESKGSIFVHIGFDLSQVLAP